MREIRSCTVYDGEAHIYGRSLGKLVELGSVVSGYGYHDGLVGVSATEVSIRRGQMVYLYSAEGNLLIQENYGLWARAQQSKTRISGGGVLATSIASCFRLDDGVYLFGRDLQTPAKLGVIPTFPGDQLVEVTEQHLSLLRQAHVHTYNRYGHPIGARALIEWLTQKR